MTFLTILAALVAERYLLPLEGLRAAPWFGRYFDWHQALPVPVAWRSGFPGFLGLVLVPVVLTAVLEQLVSGRLGGLPEWIFGTLVLLYTLGPNALEPQVQALVAAQRGDDSARAAVLAEALSAGEAAAAGNATARLCQGVLVQANRRVFAVLCWFALIGPAGAVLYRFSHQVAQLARNQAREGLLPATEQTLALLDWIPARATAIGYALAGCFEGALAGWRGCQRYIGALAPERLLGCTALGSLGHGAQGDQAFALERALALYLRTLVLWVVLLGLTTLPGWLS